MSHEEISRLRVSELDFYWKAITVIEAQQTILALKISDWPYLKKDAREKFHRELHKQAFPVSYSKEITTEDFAKILNKGLRHGK